MTHEIPSEFESTKKNRIKINQSDAQYISLANKFLLESYKNKYSYNFNWLGIPVIQFPEDIILMQEIIFNIKPDLIIETGVARGGSIIFYASLLKLLNKKKVIGIDVDILDFNENAIYNHFLSDKIELLTGDSTSEETFLKAKSKVCAGDVVIVCLDSNHSQQHVYRELKLYSDLVSIDSYLVVFDSTIQSLANDAINELRSQYQIKDWGKDNNPGSAVEKFLQEDNRFVYDDYFNSKAVVSNCRGGFLKRIS